MLVPSRNVIPSWTPRVWARSSRRSHTPRRAQRRKVWAARDHGPRSAGMARHLAPFWCRQTIADSVRRRSFGCVLPLGRHASTNGSKLIQCASDSIALSSFQEGQNARHHNRFKREQALATRLAGKTAAETISVMLAVFGRIDPALRKSVTFDNDTAFAQHALLRSTRNMTTWFCDAYASWQKGGVENANGRLRRWLPRHLDIDQ